MVVPSAARGCQPVEQLGQLVGGHAVDAAAVADLVEHDLHPAAAVLLGLGDVPLQRLDRGGGGRPGSVRVRYGSGGGIGFSGRAGGAADSAHLASAVVAAHGRDLLGGRIELAVRVGEVGDGEPVAEQRQPVVADLPLLVVGAERRQVGMVDGVPADLVAGGGELMDIGEGQPIRVAEQSADDEEGAVHPMGTQQRAGHRRVLPAVVELERHDRVRVCMRRAGSRCQQHRRDHGHAYQASPACPKQRAPRDHSDHPPGAILSDEALMC